MNQTRKQKSTMPMPNAAICILTVSSPSPLRSRMPMLLRSSPTVSISKLTRFKMRREKKYSTQLAVNRITNGAAG